MMYEANNIDLFQAQMRNNVRAQMLSAGEPYIKGVKINRPGSDLSGYHIADEISLNVQSQEHIKSNLAYAKQIVKSALRDTKAVKRELNNLHTLIVKSFGKAGTCRAQIQKEVDDSLKRIERVLGNTFSGIHMLNGSGTSVEVALDSRCYSDPNLAPKMTVPGQDLTLSSLTIKNLHVDVKKRMSDGTCEFKDTENIEKIGTALAMVRDAQTAFAADLETITAQENLVLNKIDALKAQYDRLVEVGSGEELARRQAVEIKDYLLAVQSCKLIRGEGQTSINQMMRRIR